MVDIESILLPGDWLYLCCSVIPSFCMISLPIRLFVLWPTTSILQFCAVQDPDWSVRFSSLSIFMRLLLKHLYFVWLAYGWSFVLRLFINILFAWSRVMTLLWGPVSTSDCILKLFVVFVFNHISFAWVRFRLMHFTSENEDGAMWFTSARSSESSLMYSADSGLTDSISFCSSWSFCSFITLSGFDVRLVGFLVPGDVGMLLLGLFFEQEVVVSLTYTFWQSGLFSCDFYIRLVFLYIDSYNLGKIFLRISSIVLCLYLFFEFVVVEAVGRDVCYCLKLRSLSCSNLMLMNVKSFFGFLVLSPWIMESLGLGLGCGLRITAPSVLLCCSS